MDDKELITLTETAARSKSNTHAIGELKDEVKEIRNEQKALYELTSSVKMIANDMTKMNSSIEEVKQGQKDLTNKMDKQITEVKGQIEKVDEKSKIDIIETQRNKIKQNITPFLIGGGSVGLIIYIISEVIKMFAK